MGEKCQVDYTNNEIVRLRNEITALKEQLDIARTALRDTEEFRERDKKHAEAVMTGLRLAIIALADGLKGGN
jgi:nitrogen fixation/metabolism regulation signal transduction histidine kinase